MTGFGKEKKGKFSRRNSFIFSRLCNRYCGMRHVQGYRITGSRGQIDDKQVLRYSNEFVRHFVCVLGSR